MAVSCERAGHPPRRGGVFSRNRAVLLAAVVAGLCAPRFSQATAYYWDPSASNASPGSGGDGNWDLTDPYWFPTGGPSDVAWPNSGTDSAVFAGTAGTVTVTQNLTVAGMTFNTAGYTLQGSAGVTLTSKGSIAVSDSGGTTTITVPISVGANQSWSAATGDTLAVSGAVSGASTVTVTGAGNVTYTGSSFATGKFVVNGGGTFNFNGTANLPASGGFTGAGDGSNGKINVLGGTLNTACSVFIGNNSTSSINVSAGTFHVTGANFLLGDGYNNGGGGNGTLTLSGTAAVNLGATTGLFSIGNSGAGVGTVNLDGGTLSLNKTIAKGSYSAGTGHTNTFNFNGGTLQATGSSLTMSGLTQANVRNSGATIDTQSFNITLAQPLIHSTIGGDNAVDGGLTKLGSGMLTLSGAYTYTGSTGVNAGTLLLDAINTGSGAITVSSGATLGGSGSAAGAITINSGGAITAGPDAGTTGTFTAGGGLTLSSNSDFFFKLSSNDPSSVSGYTTGGAPPNGGGAAGTWDQLSFTALAVTSSPASPAKVTIDYNGTGTFNTSSPFSIPIAYGPANSINNGTALAANLLVLDTADSTLPAGTSASNFSLDESADESAIDLVFTPTAAPEPGSAVLVGLGMAGLLSRRRRRSLRQSS